MKKVDTRKLVNVALLIGLNIVFSRFVSISAWNFKISFTFATLLVAGYLYGPTEALIVGGIGDLIGSLLFPIGAYNPLLTLTAGLSGVIFGLFIYNDLSIKRIVPMVLINQIGVSLLLNTLIISIMYNVEFWHLFATRAIQCVIMIVVEIITAKALSAFIPKLKK